MVKLFYSDSFDTTADVGMRLFEDTASLKKSASTVFGVDYDALKPDKDHVGIHVVALGAHERYGCFFAGAPVSTAAGQVAIQDVKVGDLVLTHAGNYKPVLKTFSSEYSGDRATLAFRGMPDPVECTAEHPFLIVRRDGLSPASIWKLREADTLADELDRRVASAEWVPADRVRPGDFAVIPTELSPEQAATTESPAPEYDPYVSGFYLAEGCLTKEYKDIFTKGEVKSVLITCAEGDAAALDYIDGWLVSIGRKPVARVESYTSAVGVRYMFGYKEYATWLEKTFGGHAESKHLAPTVWKWGHEQRLKFLAGYFDGDGCLQHGDNRYTGTLTVSTASRTLALDVQRLLASVGIPSSVCQCWNKGSNGCFGHGDFKIYSLSVGGYQSNKIIKYSTRFTQHTRQFKQRGSASMQLGHKYALVPVANVALDQVENKTKYNLEIADDNSYVVDVQAHNCNRNFDAFSKAACLKYHDTFVKHGHVYRHHRNKDPNKALGQIKASAYNPEMDRVELFIHAHKEKAADELARLEKEGEIPFSMACVVDPEYPVLTRDRGYVAISTITTADYVLAEDRQWHQVTALNRRVYTGPCSRLHFYGLSMPLALTDDHMLKMKLFGQPDSVKRAFRDSAAYDECTPDWAHVSHVVVNDRVMAQAPGRYPGYCAIDSIDLARVMGYYLAEGSFGFNGDRACTVNLTCNMSDSLPRVVPEIIERMLPGTTCKMRPHRVSPSCLNVEIFNTEFAELLRKYVGRTCHLKFVCPELFNSDEDVKLAYLGAWLDGDGFVDIKGVHWSTCNRNLALQGRDLLASIGIPSSVYAIDHAKCETSGHVGSGMEYMLNISRCDAARLAPWSSKVSTNKFPALTRSKPPAMRAESSDQLLYAYRVKHVDHYDVVAAQTYNIEVADCPSYTIGGLISHNCRVPNDKCSICGNLRKNASDPNQCDHIKHEFGKQYDDGKVAFTFNDEPDFFDISFVGRPADRIAWQLKVASGDAESSIKLAEYEGVSVPDSLAIDSEIGLRKLAHLKHVVHMHDSYRGWLTKTARQKSSRDFYLYELRKAAGAKLPDSVIGRLREFEPTVAFTAMAKAGMVMDVESFFKYAMGPEYRQLQDLVPEIAAAVPVVMKKAVDSGTCQNLCNVSTFDVPDRRAYPSREVPGSLITKLASASIVGQPMVERVIAATVEQKNIKFAVDTSNKIESNTTLTEALAEKYAAYQLSAIDAVLSLHDTDPDYVRAISAAQNLMI